MNYHFFPRIEDLETAVTLVNVPPTGPWPAASKPEREVAHAIWSDGERWRVEPLGEIPAGGMLTVDRTMLPFDGPGLIFLFLHPAPLPATVDRPPVSRRLASSPEWRANIRLSGRTTSTSFQGEYPSAMTAITAGSLLSIAPMLQIGAGVRTIFLLANMRADPTFDTASLRFLRLDDRTVLAEHEVRYNMLTVIDLGPMVEDDQVPLVAVSPNITGVPMYLSFDAERRHISLEHSHPPLEGVVFGDRAAVQRDMKQWWLRAAGW